MTTFAGPLDPLLRLEVTAENRTPPQNGERLGAHLHQTNPLRLVAARQVRVHDVIGDHALEDRRARPVIEEVPGRDPLVVRALRMDLRDQDELVLVGVRERREEEAVRHGESRRIRRDSHRQRYGRHRGDHRGLGQHPDAVAHVEQEIMHMIVYGISAGGGSRLIADG